MEILKDLGLGIVFILILAFAVFFVMLSVMFIIGLPQLYVHFLGKVGKRLEAKFPNFAKNKNVRGLSAIFLVLSACSVLIGAILLWGLIYEWLPR